MVKIITRFLVILFIHGIEIVMMKYLFLIKEKAYSRSELTWLLEEVSGRMYGCIVIMLKKVLKTVMSCCIDNFLGRRGVLGVDLCACIKTIKLNCGSTSLVVAIGTILKIYFYSFWYNWNKMHLGKNCYPKIISTNWN